jgi:hypothetical protein
LFDKAEISTVKAVKGKGPCRAGADLHLPGGPTSASEGVGRAASWRDVTLRDPTRRRISLRCIGR